MLKELSPGSTDFTVTIFKILQMSKHFSAMPFGTQTNHQIVTKYKRSFRSRESHLQLYKVLTKVGILNGRFFKDRNIGKFACHEGNRSFVVDYLLMDYEYLAEALITIERKLQNIKEASMRKVRFHSDQNNCPCRKKKTQCHGISTNIKKPKS